MKGAARLHSGSGRRSNERTAAAGLSLDAAIRYGREGVEPLL
ncbi:hypothetical protein HNR23_000283 [Nocardiopsis mwathae]|uniref:Uncharacterized protein n=1 Tax=Nocardiopsis mwathae TaxID=1472723 RepID=A0A7X0D3I3_9ACTN|nr:hypothetical protein [Nocardiopsis mwathae]